MQEQGPCIFGDIGETDGGGMPVSDDSSEVLSCRNGCQGEKAVTEIFNKVAKHQLGQGWIFVLHQWQKHNQWFL